MRSTSSGEPVTPRARADVRSPVPGPLDRAGTLLLIGSLGLLTFGLLRGSEQTLVQLGFACLGIVCFLVLQRRVAAPTLDLDLFRVPAFTGAAVAISLSRVLTIGGTVHLVQFLDGALHLTPTRNGLPLALVAPLVLRGVGGGIAGAPVFSVAMSVIDRSRAGMAAGVITSLAALGALFEGQLVSAGLSVLAVLTALTLISSSRAPKPA